MPSDYENTQPKQMKGYKMKIKREWVTKVPMKISEMFGKDEFWLYITLTLNAGLRPSESAALNWGDISNEPIEIRGEKYGTIAVSKAIIRTADGIKETLPKYDSSTRTVYVHWQLIDDIHSLKIRGNDNERIFHTFPHYTEYDRRWARIKKDLSLPPELKWFNLRRYFIYSSFRSGFSKDDILQQTENRDLVLLPDRYFENLRRHMLNEKSGKVSQWI